MKTYYKIGKAYPVHIDRALPLKGQDHITCMDILCFNLVCGNKPMPAEYQNIDVWNLEETPLAVLLPNWRGYGICAIAILYFLASIQNDFLETYAKFTKTRYDVFF